ncbi:MAG: YicC/YloC family endoribonuclease [Gammaproteobacteria bacterium]
MAHSMTAFARHSSSGEWGNAVWEIRSVNNRYLDINLRLPEELRGLEHQLREKISNKLKRGKVDCTLRYKTESKQTSLKVNLPLVKELADATKEIKNIVYESTALNPIDVLNWPGVLNSPELDLESMGKAITSLIDQTLEILIETRQREGKALIDLIETRCNSAQAQVTNIRQQMPAIVQSLNKKLIERVEEIVERMDETRLEQEVALLAQKLDVDEELDRLDAHISEVLRVISQKGPIGRRLDFLMQEMNREANTLGSKSAHMQSTEASIELKVLIEQMREQIQNIE